MKLKLHYYYFQIYISLKVPAKEKRKIMAMMKENIEQYLTDNSDCTVAQVKEYFGGLDTVEDPEKGFCEQKKAIRRRIWKTILWTLLGLSTLFLIFFLALYLVQQITIPTYIE